MAKVCVITGKKNMSGNKRSHAMNASRRKWKANLHKVKLEIDGREQTVYVSARGLRTLNKEA